MPLFLLRDGHQRMGKAKLKSGVNSVHIEVEGGQMSWGLWVIDGDSFQLEDKTMARGEREDIEGAFLGFEGLHHPPPLPDLWDHKKCFWVFHSPENLFILDLLLI